MAPPQNWIYLDQFVEIRSPWTRLLGERWQDQKGRILDYWRVERADSVIILPIQNGEILLPKPQFRPGLKTQTWDFPGGRIREELSAGAEAILAQELGIGSSDIAQLLPLNAEGWAINSSFSNQKLYGYLARLEPQGRIDPDLLGERWPLAPLDWSHCLGRLTCLQCRAVFWEAHHQGLLTA
ncbi:MAG: NUDIX hydrolase [Cyanobacteriota bacterium]|nr:NUDIX hydrolase [Cyanobacteriota bacterium]